LVFGQLVVHSHRVTEGWSSTEEIVAARDRFEEALGWRRPAAYAVGRDVGGQIEFGRINIAENYLPGVILATVAGHRSGTGSYQMSAAALDEAITLLAPAEACTEYQHPNLNTWKHLRADIGPHEYVVAVFIDDLATHTNDPGAAALLDAITAGRHNNANGTTTLWRPSGPPELELVRRSGWRAWPPRLPDQPIFYPVLNERYAATIARDWNVAASGVGYVTRFDVDTEFLRRYPTRRAGGGAFSNCGSRLRNSTSSTRTLSAPSKSSTSSAPR
jgi:hypothetical protein